ncbi:hypothetical protein CFP56_009579 [Quercus suber]|uniref:Uncharacterized protein n=1 Tax=Quercus suber TaxID=58331 RepID=A0AAW0M751_QUESU
MATCKEGEPPMQLQRRGPNSPGPNYAKIMPDNLESLIPSKDKSKYWRLVKRPIVNGIDPSYHNNQSSLSNFFCRICVLFVLAYTGHLYTCNNESQYI